MKEKKEKNNAWGVASLVMGIFGMVTPYISFIFAILAIIFAVQQRKIQPNGFATAGLVLGIIGLVLWVIMMLFIVSLFSIIGTGV